MNFLDSGGLTCGTMTKSESRSGIEDAAPGQEAADLEDSNRTGGNLSKIGQLGDGVKP